ncbi:MAG TPA: hypothetical protein VMZ91_12945 [Candidatus Paceibacterota bacterium]|nr:hypothetical protein [Candidatus Paceibacterota bacterium]
METQTEQENGVFITPQEELTESVYNNLLMKPKHKEINKEMSKFIGNLN